MSMTDPISDMLTRIRNAGSSRPSARSIDAESTGTREMAVTVPRPAP